MVLMLDELAAVTRVRPDIPAPCPPLRLARTLARLGFAPGYATPRYAGAAPIRPNRRGDATTADWRPL